MIWFMVIACALIWGFPFMVSVFVWYGNVQLLDVDSSLILPLFESTAELIDMDWTTKIQIGRKVSVISSLESFRRDGKFIDVTLVCRNGNIEAHKNVLSADCQYFETMFNSGMVEASSGRMEFKDFRTEAMDCVVTYLYTGTVAEKLKSDSLLMREVLSIAHLMQISPFFNYCWTIYVQKINNNTVVEVWKLAELFNQNAAASLALDFAIVNFKKLTDGVAMLDLSLMQVEKIIEKSLPYQTSDDLLKFVLKWGNYQSKTRITSVSKLVKLIDLSKLSNDYLHLILYQEKYLKESPQLKDLLVEQAVLRLKVTKNPDENTITSRKLLCKNTKWEWTNAHEKVFRALKETLVGETARQFVDWTKPFILETASYDGIGADENDREENAFCANVEKRIGPLAVQSKSVEDLNGKYAEIKFVRFSTTKSELEINSFLVEKNVWVTENRKLPNTEIDFTKYKPYFIFCTKSNWYWMSCSHNKIFKYDHVLNTMNEVVALNTNCMQVVHYENCFYFWNTKNEFIQFDYNVNSATMLKRFCGDFKSCTLLATSNGLFVSNTNSGNISKYNEAADLWELRTKMPFCYQNQFVPAACQGKLYFYWCSLSFLYDPVSDKWSSKHCFNTNDKTLICTYCNQPFFLWFRESEQEKRCFWLHDPVADKWQKLPADARKTNWDAITIDTTDA